MYIGFLRSVGECIHCVFSWREMKIMAQLMLPFQLVGEHVNNSRLLHLNLEVLMSSRNQHWSQGIGKGREGCSCGVYVYTHW